VGHLLKLLLRLLPHPLTTTIETHEITTPVGYLLAPAQGGGRRRKEEEGGVVGGGLVVAPLIFK